MTTMQFSTYGKVIDALVAIPAADAMGSGFYLASGDRPAPVISDGTYVGEWPLELVAIGIPATTAPTGQPDVGHQQTPVMGTPLAVDEEYDILGYIRVYDGDPNAQKKVRDRAFDLLSVFSYALRSNPTLGLGSMQAWIDMLDLNQDDPAAIADGGSIAWLAFTVHVKNRLNGL